MANMYEVTVTIKVLADDDAEASQYVEANLEKGDFTTWSVTDVSEVEN
jgi:hypothetical protein